MRVHAKKASLARFFVLILAYIKKNAYLCTENENEDFIHMPRQHMPVGDGGDGDERTLSPSRCG